MKKKILNFYYNKLGEVILKRKLLPQLKKHSTHKINNFKLDNILHINGFDNKGGAAKISYNLQGVLNSQGYNSKTLVANKVSVDDNNIGFFPKQENERIKKLQHWQTEEGILDFFYLETFDLLEHPWFKTADVIHLHNLSLFYFNPFVLPLLTSLKPTIWTLHDMSPFTGHCIQSLKCEKWKFGCGDCPHLEIYPPLKKDKTKYLLETKREIYKNSTFSIACPSSWLLNKIPNSILEDKPASLVQNSIHEEFFKKRNKKELRSKLNLPLDKVILAYSSVGGESNPLKGNYIKTLIESFKDRSEIFWIVIGGDKVRQNDFVKGTGYLSSEAAIADHLTAADLFIYPSLADSFGLVAAEAIACGTPVIAFSETGVTEVIDHLQTGYLSKYDDVGDLIDGIELFISNHSFRIKAGEKGRAIAKRKFSVDVMTDKYITLYEEQIKKTVIA